MSCKNCSRPGKIIPKTKTQGSLRKVKREEQRRLTRGKLVLRA